MEKLILFCSWHVFYIRCYFEAVVISRLILFKGWFYFRWLMLCEDWYCSLADNNTFHSWHYFPSLCYFSADIVSNLIFFHNQLFQCWLNLIAHVMSQYNPWPMLFLGQCNFLAMLFLGQCYISTDVISQLVLVLQVVLLFQTDAVLQLK